jgi:pimeloyl-ACP methyl ester carboxylesterase
MVEIRTRGERKGRNLSNTVAAGYSTGSPVRTTLADPLSAKRTDISSIAGRIAFYAAGSFSPDNSPLLLIHSVNAAASAYEVKPLFDAYSRKRAVYAFDLPGFGQSDRGDREYSVRTMTDAVHAAASEVWRLHRMPVDVIALSLSAEFVARAAAEKPEMFRKLAFVSPTGFEGKARDKAGGTRAKPWLRGFLELPWGPALFSLSTTKPVIRKFLERTWGSKKIDEGLLDYNYRTAHQPGAQHAPWYFVSGYMFGKDILNIYQSLPHEIWLTHGTRGDFVDYHHVKRVEGKPNWRIEIFDTGAFPHFEKLDAFSDSYERFLNGHT